MDIQVLRNTLERARNENGGLQNLGMSFYARLFSKYPGVRPLFNTPPEEQHKKLMASLGAIVAAADKPETLMPYLHAMGIRHLKYRTENGHYAAVGENLMAVLKEHLSKDGEWTEEHQANWSEALELVSKVMIEAADNPEKYAEELKAAGYETDGFRKQSNEPWKLPETATTK